MQTKIQKMNKKDKKKWMHVQKCANYEEIISKTRIF